MTGEYMFRRRKPRLDHPPEPGKPDGRVCPDCNVIRQPNEFKLYGVDYANCCNCWPKHGRKRK